MAESSLLSDTVMRDVELGKIVVEPSEGQVDAQLSTTISFTFFPGLVGEFQQHFTIHVRLHWILVNALFICITFGIVAINVLKSNPQHNKYRILSLL